MKKILFLSVLFSSFAYSQGCSDAGICTMSNLKPNEMQTLSNTIKVGFNYGAADNDVNVLGSYLEYQRVFNEKWSAAAKLTYFSQNNDDFSSSSLADLYLSTNYSINSKTKATVGLKVPFTDGNLKENGVPLPMDFQPSLGTYDLILGASHQYKSFNFVVAYQQPLTQNNNQYTIYPILVATNIPYLNTNNFKRAADVLARVTYNWELNDKFTLKPSVLPIYHLAKDKATSFGGNEYEIQGSEGLTLNTNVFLNYALNTKSNLEFSFGVPFVVREVRPDGLTRSMVLNLQYAYSF